MISNTDIFIIFSAIMIVYIFLYVFDEKIFPKIVNYSTKEIERNPKWVTSRLRYYGFDDIDIILCECKFGKLPRFRITKEGRLELLIDNDTSTNDVEEIGRIALIAKINAMYGLWFPEKPIYWLSVLCYMLDGGDLQMTQLPLNNK